LGFNWDFNLVKLQFGFEVHMALLTEVDADDLRFGELKTVGISPVVELIKAKLQLPFNARHLRSVRTNNKIVDIQRTVYTRGQAFDNMVDL
jgi:hypothetical protein